MSTIGAVRDAEPLAWVAVNSQPHRERVACENLLRQEFSVYCPLVRKRVRHARRVQDVMRPMFPGYLFVQVAKDLGQWRPILSTFGVRTLVRFGDRPGLISDGFITALRAREVEGAIVKPPSPYKVGQVVQVAGGAFDGIVATILEMDEKDRLVVLMNLLGQSVKAKIEASGVRAP